MSHEVKPITAKSLRQFGFLMAGIIGGVFGLALPLLFGREKFPHWPWYFFAFFFTFALVRPTFLDFIFRAWMAFGEKLGAINTYLIMNLSYWVIVTPMAILSRIFNKRFLDCSVDPKRETYKVVYKEKASAEGMENPF